MDNDQMDFQAVVDALAEQVRVLSVQNAILAGRLAVATAAAAAAGEPAAPDPGAPTKGA